MESPYSLLLSLFIYCLCEFVSLAAATTTKGRAERVPNSNICYVLRNFQERRYTRIHIGKESIAEQTQNKHGDAACIICYTLKRDDKRPRKEYHCVDNRHTHAHTHCARAHNGYFFWQTNRLLWRFFGVVFVFVVGCDAPRTAALSKLYYAENNEVGCESYRELYKYCTGGDSDNEDSKLDWLNGKARSFVFVLSIMYAYAMYYSSNKSNK